MSLVRPGFGGAAAALVFMLVMGPVVVGTGCTTTEEGGFRDLDGGSELDAPLTDGAQTRTDAPASCQNATPGNKALGAACTCASDCGSGFCVDGVCCNTTCEGLCRACNIAGTVGT